MSNIQEKAEQYAREKHGRCANGGIDKVNSAQDYIAGYDFAMAQPKHIFEGVAQVGEVRRFEGELVDVIDSSNEYMCDNCIFWDFDLDHDCQYLTGCDTHNVKYIKR